VWILILEMLIDDFIETLVTGLLWISLISIALYIVLLVFTLGARVVVFSKKSIDPIEAIRPKKKKKRTGADYIQDSLESNEDYRKITGL